jgi:hypothetical protein
MDEEDLRQKIKDIIYQELESAKAFQIPLLQIHLHLSEASKYSDFGVDKLTRGLQRDLWLNRIAEKLVHSLEERKGTANREDSPSSIESWIGDGPVRPRGIQSSLT